VTLSLRNIGHRFGDFALRENDLDVAAGDYWVLLGPSGAGKSMLLHTIAGFHRPACGTIHLADRDATDEPPESRDIGLVFQHAALFPHLSVADNIGYGLVHRLSASERLRRIDEIVTAMGLAKLLHRPVATLSGGEAQRVAIARALAIRPVLLLLDEPLSLVDHNARMELRETIAQVHRDFAMTTLHVTHSRDEAQALGDHLAVMLDGHIVQSGPTEQVFTTPRCGFVADFLGVEPAAAHSCTGTCIVAGSCELVDAPPTPSEVG
jgi:ABC-type sugar transport system ATPase subunit